MGEYAIEDEISFEGLDAALRHHNPLRRKRAAANLAAFGTRAVEPLCAALQDTDRSVRDAAANSLGVIGDVRAVGPLIDALRDAFAWRRPWVQFIAGLALVGVAIVAEVFVVLALVVVFLILLGLTWLSIDWGSGAGLEGIWSVGGSALKGTFNLFRIGDFFHYRRRQNEYCETIAKALVRIAERSPSPQLRDALPDLGAVAGDFIQQDSRTRETARAVAQRIEALTAKLRNLPAPAHAPEADVSALPRAATVPVIDEQTLPRAVDAALNDNH